MGKKSIIKIIIVSSVILFSLLMVYSSAGQTNTADIGGKVVSQSAVKQAIVTYPEQFGKQGEPDDDVLSKYLLPIPCVPVIQEENTYENDSVYDDETYSVEGESTDVEVIDGYDYGQEFECNTESNEESYLNLEASSEMYSEDLEEADLQELQEPETEYTEPEPEQEYTEPASEETYDESYEESYEDSFEESNDDGWIYYSSSSRITHYCHCATCNGWAYQNTASGAWPAAYYTCAAGYDLPFGTEVLINGSVYVVQDRGVPEGCFDIFVGDDHQTALDMGEYYTEVYIRFPN